MDPFATLGLPRRYEVDMQQLETRYRELQKALHPDKHAGASASQRKLSLAKAIEVNTAYRTLKDDLQRAEALLGLYAEGETRTTPAEEAEFLMQVMELRETLQEAKSAHDIERVRTLARDVGLSLQQAAGELVLIFDALAQAKSPAQLSRAAALVGRLKYYRRFIDETLAIEEQELG